MKKVKVAGMAACKGGLGTIRAMAGMATPGGATDAPVNLYRERPPYLVKSVVGLAEMVVEASPLPEAQMALISDAGLQVGEYMFHVRFITKEGGTVGVELSVAQDKGPDLVAVALSQRDGVGTIRLQVWEPHVEGEVWLPVETIYEV